MPTDVESMSKKDAVLIVSRAFALYFVCWAADNLTYLPGRIHSLSYRRSVLYSENYFHWADMISLLSLIVRVVVLLAVAMCFIEVDRVSSRSFLLPERKITRNEKFLCKCGGSWPGLPVLDQLAEGCPTFAVFEAWLVEIDDQKNQKPRLSGGLRMGTPSVKHFDYRSKSRLISHFPWTTQ